MGDLPSTKCIIYANLNILIMKKILSYNPIRSAGCVTVENYKNSFSTLHHLFGYFHISCYFDELPLSV